MMQEWKVILFACALVGIFGLGLYTLLHLIIEWFVNLCEWLIDLCVLNKEERKEKHKEKQKSRRGIAQELSRKP
ncbi:hypothetical protein IGJ51_000349 [Enterococcus sp. DIV0802c]|uniref:hypothetical protein n=1 Tax=Enterococcus sp. DIV0802c TaxID=2774743 RepID=UPI003F263B74